MFSLYKPCSTGGGCVAYTREVDNIQIYLTNSLDESKLPQADGLIDVGLTYKGIGDPIEEKDGLTPADAEQYIQSVLAKLEPKPWA